MTIKEQIVLQATDMFIRIGFKSVTLDDVASKLAISKKTIYKHFANKEDLIEECVDFVHYQIKDNINIIFDLKRNAIEENFLIRDMFNQLFKTDGDSPAYQLKKHYPRIYSNVRNREAIQCQNMFVENIKRGILQGYYKSDIDPEMIANLYYLLIISINETYPNEKEVEKIELEAMKYHIASIATEEGKKEFDLQLHNYTQK